ncbi:hypothetical protein FQN57_000856 [Myotisia sp. PD_48]|nr:hypothetical protein FQN57_000856 [Myotisia sp. PD_48]
MKILVAPTGFKESLEAKVAADCIEEGILRACPDAEIRKVPLFDGGEGFANGLVDATGGDVTEIEVTGPVRIPVNSSFGYLGSDGPRTAVLDMAAAAGLRLVPKQMRDPMVTTTYGVGELILAALDGGARRIILGCGDSGTSDGGVGMCQALGVRFLDHEGTELPKAAGGGSLSNLASIDLSGLDPRLAKVEIDVLCNWKNVLCGPKGVARVYGPQKGATEKQVNLLANALETYAAIVESKTGISVAFQPGSGASGGLGAGLLLLGARLRPRFDAITEYFGLETFLDDCDLVYTAEGGIDYQTPQGKMPAEVAKRAKCRGIPVIVLAGTIGTDARINYEAGIDAFSSIVQGPITLEEAIIHAAELLEDAAETSMRMVAIGQGLRGTKRLPTRGEKLVVAEQEVVRTRGWKAGFNKVTARAAFSMFFFYSLLKLGIAL